MYLIHFFKTMKHWNLDTIGSWVICAGCPLEKDLELGLVLQIVQKFLENYCPCLYLSISQSWWLNELWFQTYILKCTLPHVLILIMTSSIWWINVKYTKTSRSWEWNLTFLRKKKILNLYLWWHILRMLWTRGGGVNLQMLSLSSLLLLNFKIDRK